MCDARNRRVAGLKEWQELRFADRGANDRRRPLPRHHREDRRGAPEVVRRARRPRHQRHASDRSARTPAISRRHTRRFSIEGVTDGQAKLTGDDAVALVPRGVHDLAVSLGNYKFTNWKKLTPAQRSKLNEQRSPAAHVVVGSRGRWPGIVLEDSKVSLAEIEGATEQPGRRGEHDQDGQEGDQHRDGKAVGLAAAIASKDRCNRDQHRELGQGGDRQSSRGELPAGEAARRLAVRCPTAPHPRPCRPATEGSEHEHDHTMSKSEREAFLAGDPRRRLLSVAGGIGRGPLTVPKDLGTTHVCRAAPCVSSRVGVSGRRAACAPALRASLPSRADRESSALQARQHRRAPCGSSAKPDHESATSAPSPSATSGRTWARCDGRDRFAGARGCRSRRFRRSPPNAG